MTRIIHVQLNGLYKVENRTLFKIFKKMHDLALAECENCIYPVDHAVARLIHHDARDDIGGAWGLKSGAVNALDPLRNKAQ